MKIEVGESLIYSWLRHVKACQIVQTNWKTSGQWSLMHEEKLTEIKNITNQHFQKKYGYDIYKKTSSLSQFLQQAECDLIGINIQNNSNNIYAVDVAFHKDGLIYKNKTNSVESIIKKCVRTAICIYGYLDISEAEIIFASPKITKGTLDALLPCINDLQNIMNDLGFRFRFILLANDDFRDKILEPTLNISNVVADTNELFVRSYQMTQMFEKKAHKSK